MEVSGAKQLPPMDFKPVLFGSAAFGFLNFALPIYTRDLGANAVAIGGLYTAFTGSMLLFRPLIGIALDRFGRRRFFTAAFLFFTVSMLAFSQAHGLMGLYVARFLQGIGASLMWVSARTIIADTTTSLSRGSRMGLLSARSVQGGMIGAVYGFTLVAMMPLREAWQFAFLGYSIAAFIGFLLALGQGETAPKRSPESTPITLNTPMKKIMVIVFLSGFASALIEPIYLIFLKDKFDLPIEFLACAFFPAGIVFAIVPQRAGRLSDRYGRSILITIGVAMSGLVCIALPWLPSIFLVAAFYTFFSVGWALARPAENALAGDLASEETRGRVFGYKEASASLGYALGPLAGGLIYEVLGAHWTFLINGTMLLFTAGLTFLWFSDNGNRPETRPIASVLELTTLPAGKSHDASTRDK